MSQGTIIDSCVFISHRFGNSIDARNEQDERQSASQPSCGRIESAQRRLRRPRVGENESAGRTQFLLWRAIVSRRSSPTAAAITPIGSVHQQQQQQQPAKRSMDDVLKKLTSKMHISHSPVLDEADPFNKDRSVGLCAYTAPYSISVCIHTQSSKILLKWGNYLSSLALHLLRSSTKGGSP